jgi:hypothetical protein
MNSKAWIATLCLGLSACLGAPAVDSPVVTTSFTITVEGIAPMYPYFASGYFTIPVGAAESGPLMPGDSYSVEFHAPPGTRLSFATMFLNSNDLFFAPAGEGIELFDGEGQPRSGDVTDLVQLWDAGTELDEDLGLGYYQPSTQLNPNHGDADPNTNVRLASESYPNLPAIADMIGVTLSAGEGNSFTLTLENRSTEQTLMLTDATTSSVPLSPGVFVIHEYLDPLFAVGQPGGAMGLEALVEDGNYIEILNTLVAQSGVVSPLAPGLWVVHGESDQGELFHPGQADYGRGLESLAEDGDPAALLAYYVDPAAMLTEDGEQANIGIFGGVYDDDLIPLVPGGLFTFDIEARAGDRLSFASMFGQSNDMFLATTQSGVELFYSSGAPIEGDISDTIYMWDAGTEVNEHLGAGPNQAPRQAAPNSSLDEGGLVQLADTFLSPEATDLVRVTIVAN